MIVVLIVVGFIFYALSRAKPPVTEVQPPVTEVQPPVTGEFPELAPKTYTPKEAATAYVAEEISSEEAAAAGVSRTDIFEASFEAEKPPAPPINGLIGDLNNDGRVDKEDMKILSMYILNQPIADISPLDKEEFLYRANINKDGVINVLDMTAMSKLIGVTG